ncbi:MAG: hypothetical protein P8P83_01140 [Rickettsiaceae bacterium]|nr:hypothetical protein [Rickettsiaceae bacterium]
MTKRKIVDLTNNRDYVPLSQNYSQKARAITPESESDTLSYEGENGTPISESESEIFDYNLPIFHNEWFPDNITTDTLYIGGSKHYHINSCINASNIFIDKDTQVTFYKTVYSNINIGNICIDYAINLPTPFRLSCINNCQVSLVLEGEQFILPDTINNELALSGEITETHFI